MVNRLDMIRYINCTLESATNRQIEEVFSDVCDHLEIEIADNLSPMEMVEAISEAMKEASDRQVDDIYWSVLWACD